MFNENAFESSNARETLPKNSASPHKTPTAPLSSRRRGPVVTYTLLWLLLEVLETPQDAFDSFKPRETLPKQCKSLQNPKSVPPPYS